MLNPDVEKVHDEYYRVYFHGRIFDVNRVADGWTVKTGYSTAPIYHSAHFVDAFAWLKAQVTV